MDNNFDTVSVSEKEFFQIVFNTVSVSVHLPTQDRLKVLMMAWLMIASQERSDAKAVPGGFPEAQARQRAILASMSGLVEGDVPDFEAERLFHEGDFDGMMEHLRHQISQINRESET